jgi:hypothetical protein
VAVCWAQNGDRFAAGCAVRATASELPPATRTAIILEGIILELARHLTPNCPKKEGLLD